MSKVCALIGSRRTPQTMLDFIYNIGYRLAQSGWKMRSGGAIGCDMKWQSAYESYCLVYQKPRSELIEIYLPWNGFNKNYTNDDCGVYCIENNVKADKIAKQYHPAYSTLDEYGRKFMARNCYQVLGKNLDDPVKFILCHTPDGCDGVKIPTTKDSGGTSQAIRIANAYNIPVYNLGNEEHFKRLNKWIKE